MLSRRKHYLDIVEAFSSKAGLSLRKSYPGIEVQAGIVVSPALCKSKLSCML